jgi:hypothetical protein
MEVVGLKRWFLALVLLGLVHCGGKHETSAVQATPPVAGLDVYVYSDVVMDAAARQAFLSFAQSRHIQRVYLQSANYMVSSRVALGDFIAEAKGHGISVTLLFGRANWSLVANRAAALQCVTQSQTLLTELKAAGKPLPDGIQFDVEPYILPEWTSDLQGTANQYLDLLDALRNQLGGQLTLTVATAFWLDNQPVTRAGQTRPMSEWILDAVDGIVMMDYRDRAPAILSGAASELTYASAHGKAVTLALDVQSGSDGTITFYEEGEAFMYQEMATVEAAAKSQASYRGIGVFNYEDWLLLKP